jgi:hypothetical protein
MKKNLVLLLIIKQTFTIIFIKLLYKNKTKFELVMIIILIVKLKNKFLLLLSNNY